MSKKKPAEFYSEADKLLDQQEFVESIERAFKEIPDPRVSDNQSYPLAYLLIMILAAVIAGANAITQIHQYICLKIDMFRRLLGIEQPPGYLVIWWLLIRLDPQKLQETFLYWMKELPTEVKERIIAIDGKRLNGASKQVVHLVSAWETGRGLLLGQMKTENKSNEITAIPKLLDTIDVKGATITIDAAGAQKKIVKKIRDLGADYVIALKGNQGHLHDEAQNFFEQARAIKYEGCDCAVANAVEKGHGRIEEREVVVTSLLDWLDCRADWRDLRTLIEITTRREVKGKISMERRYYISSLAMMAEKAMSIIRSHWGIENHLHWAMDVTFREDDCMVSTGNAAENFALFRRKAQSVLQAEAGGTKGIAMRRRQAGWNDDYAVKLLGMVVSGEV
jgi:predicted transposase YbfD/YdcC